MTNEQKVLPDIIQKVMIQAPIQKVWEYVSTAEAISQWFMPSDFKLEEGHEFTIQSPFGPSPCKVIEIDEPKKLVFQWDTDGWIVSFLLEEIDGETEFTLVHGGWKENGAIVPKAGRPNTEIRKTMDLGWSGIIQKLKNLVEG
ncbi:SRPBCC family protein [Lysinibacillus endophyticus]|uniref:SRPBCC domain-containing protein n=1 Tax=Ureibacillus endophyticus TaxID=1978490 RepID=A0A494YT01_9BACL|nr:SRPBCC domain-containing protein [Lysinibacillus endophyticus]MCP1146394.1 SRPBCC domain-containing protein [Lysinibacillus endophyticus]RKQ13229.1 SRPBCC domain-containing protein [Lysinibacillus endophyticus]